MVCGRHGCGRHGHRLWPLWFVAVVAVAVMVCGRHCIGSLCRCQFRGKLGKNRGYPYWILTPNEKVLSYQVPDVCAKFHQNRLKIATVRARTDRQTNRQTERHTDRDDRGDLIICPMLCYSNGTDKKLSTIFSVFHVRVVMHFMVSWQNHAHI